MQRSRYMTLESVAPLSDDHFVSRGTRIIPAHAGNPSRSGLNYTRDTILKKAKVSPVGDKQVISLLKKYACPVPYHKVRTRFLGNIATPLMSASPLQIVKALWGGELPEFESIDTHQDASQGSTGYAQGC